MPTEQRHEVLAAQTEPENVPCVQPDNYPPPSEKRGLESRVAVFGWLFLCLNVFAFGCLAAVDAQLYRVLTWEDYWVEYLTAVLSLLAGLLLFATALAERSLVRRSIYILGGILFLFGAGEEISWGQRIIGFGTPDFLLAWNGQDEFNVHNINSVPVRRTVRYAILLLCIVTCAAYFYRKDTLYGIPLPSILTMFGFVVAEAYLTRSTDPVGLGFVFHPDIIFSRGRTLLLLFAVYMLLARQTKWFSAAVATTALLLASAYVTKYDVWGLAEVEEYLLGIVCVCYALELLLAQTPARRRIAAMFGGMRLPVGRESTAAGNDNHNFAKARPVSKGLREPWLMVCALIVVCSIGLALLQYFMGRAEVADFEERYRSITMGTAGEPIIRGTFDAYLIGNELTYVKELCESADTKYQFFLHLIPANVAELPEERREYGFDNRDFWWAGEWYGGQCMVTIPLPDYTISSIRTGQFARDGRNIWTAEASVSHFNAGDEAVEFEEKYRSLTTGMAGGPVVRATFDVYLIGNELTYVKEPCEPADTEDVFFLHLTPADVDDLPGERRQYGFDNRDFGWNGAMRDGRCMATVGLPGYAISSIRTGQYVPDVGNIWQAEFTVP